MSGFVLPRLPARWIVGTARNRSVSVAHMGHRFTASQLGDLNGGLYLVGSVATESYIGYLSLATDELPFVLVCLGAMGIASQARLQSALPQLMSSPLSLTAQGAKLFFKGVRVGRTPVSKTVRTWFKSRDARQIYSTRVRQRRLQPSKLLRWV